MGRTGLEPVAR